MEQFDVPIVLIFFNRPEYFRKVLEQVGKIRPKKLYLISDGPRTNRPNELDSIMECRRMADEYITWDCDVTKNYAGVNMGCCERIGNGASWVFTKEETAIFLEDDNIPDISFFKYCKEMLDRYRDCENVFWIVGGNYLVDYETPDNLSYVFSRHMYPCGWASWRRAFKHFDDKMSKWWNINDREYVLKQVKNPKRKQDLEYSWGREAELGRIGHRQSTWDYQWSFAQYLHDGLTIVPTKNLIHNIGVSEDSTHGVTELTSYTKRLLSLETFEIEFPLVHPKQILVDENYDGKIDELLIRPDRVKFKIAEILNTIFRFNRYFSFTGQLKAKIEGKSYFDSIL